MNRSVNLVLLVAFAALIAGIVTTCSPGVYLDECPDGVIVDGECLPANCENRQCAPGFVCDQATGMCVEIDCMQVECPAGESCANGLCYPDNCETRTCPGLGDVCVDEECTSADCVDVECPDGERCAQGQCYPINCETKVCPGFGEVCIDEECVEQTCVGVECGPDERCAGGVCYPAGCTDGDCFGEGEVCIDGVCTRISCVDVECEPDPTGRETKCANGWCYPVDCLTQECSDFSEVCVDDQCVHVDCVGVVCQAGELCARGDCFPIDCGGITCEDPYVCVDNECVRSNCVGVVCPPGQTCADGECFARDCAVEGCGQGEVCVNGECVPDDCAHVTCPPGQTCGSDLQCYPDDCGGIPCEDYEVCVGNVCVDQMCIDVTCPPPQVCVAGECYDTDCGGVPCGPDEVCENDVCIPEECANFRCCPPIDCTDSNQCATYPCEEGVVFTCLHDGNQPVWGDTGSACTDLDPCTINDACTGGTCVGTDMPCDPGEVCVAGVCRCGSTGPDCVGNETCCTTECFDLDTDIDHCGDCTAQCRRDHATPQCVGGICSIGTCDALWDNCDAQDANGCETSLETLTDCGACSTDCSAAGATVSCAGGTCHITSCDPLMGDCDGDVGTGCESSLETLTHCGACDTPCVRDNATAVCPGGNCQIDTCNALFDDCDSQDANGCEVSLETLTDCGTCGTPCNRDHATADCTAGSCHIGACDALWDDCDATDANGCEVSLETLTDCGSCGTPCDRINATPDCTGGACHIQSCDSLWGDCDGVDATGCEEDLTTMTHCGACGIACVLDHATSECSTGTCLITACDALWDDCNSQHPDGCETSLETLTDCGSCGTPCGLPHSQSDCAGGTCHVGACDPLWDDCDGQQPNGCETSLETVTDCGSCGTPCSRPNAQADCTGMTCHIGTCDALWGDCDGNDPNGCEEPLTSLVHCGGCNIPCSLAHATAECSTGTCLIQSCDPLWDDCDGNDANGCETDLTTLSDCGACNIACSRAHATAQCPGGNCQILACDSLWDDCDSNDPNGCETSLETLTDCGSCSTPCSRAHATPSCAGGSCHIGSCDPLWGDCDSNDPNGCETDLTTLSDCGGCGVACSLAHATETCATGTCQVQSCDALWGNCDGNHANGCEQTLTTLVHCAACNTPCSRPHSVADCSTGVCQIGGCDPLWDDCDGNDPNGCETSLETLSDCGACNVPCSRAHATANCSGGSCHIGSCDSLWDDCDSNDPNGCETDLTTLSDCGGCGVTCSLAHATETCATGSCRVQSCDSLWGNCDGSHANGCEQTLTTLSHCGSCNTPCSRAHATATCSTGTCAIQSCDSLWDDCDGNDPNGCETDLTTLSDCGGCSIPCSRAHATASCAGGSCHISTCNSLWDDCDGNDPNGCETDLTTLSDCGGCGVTCSLAHATETCATGSCRVQSCDSLWGNCDGSHSNGCEQTLTTLVHCGACSNPCSLAHASETCTTGTCLIQSCDSLWGNCDGNQANGCETSLETTANCNGCGVSCTRAHATADCTGGSCHIGSCDSLWGNCDSNDPNGCETALNTLGNCGGCGITCALAHAIETCAGGSCQIQSCDVNWGNCDGSHPNGCEQILNTLTHCGACNNPCSLAHATETCASFFCEISTCDADWYDIDNSDVTGCECGDTDGTNDACNNAANVGTLSGSQGATRNGTIFHRTGYQTDQDCFVVTHTATNPPVNGGDFTISLSGSQLAFDVWKGGCGSLVCSNDTTYFTTCASTGATCETNNDGTYYICVRAATGQNNVCSSYTLTMQSAP